jgi:capsular polysaccharide transport system permease protein
MTARAEKKPNDSRPGLSEVAPASLPDRQAQSARAAAVAVRKARSRRLALRILFYVLLPTVMATAYYGIFASDQYESYSMFTVQSSELRPTLGMDGLLAGLAGASGPARDALAVRDYVLSRDMLARLDKEHGFIAHYKDVRKDWFSRMASDSSFEDAYEYFKRKVIADFDQSSGTVTIRVRAFNADVAALFARSILSYSEEMVNKLSERERNDRTAYAENDVKKAEGRLSLARQNIVGLQQKYEDFNPLQTATAAMTIRTQLEAELAKSRAELMQLKSFMKEDAPQVQAVNEKVKSLSAQVSGESRRLVNPSKASGLNTSLVDFEAAMVEKEFAQKAYELSMSNLEIARADADRQHRYVAVIAVPSKPDESTYPLRIRSVLTAFILSFLVWSIGSMISAAVREHARL